MKTVPVGCAIVSLEDTILIAQRQSSSLFEPNKWEFPGGKLKESETFEECIRRELREELGIEVGALNYYLTHYHTYNAPKQRTVELHVYTTTLTQGPLRLLDAQDAAWVRKDQITDYCFVEGDKPIISALLNDWEKLTQHRKLDLKNDRL